MSWKCGININEVDLPQDAPIVSDDILKRLDINHKGWAYNPARGYTFYSSVKITNDVVENGRLTIKFNKVGDNFNCSYNDLISLEGCPESVGGSFDCSCNNLVSLKGCPKKVGYNFDCGDNLLTSLEGCPESILGTFICGSNQLTSLKGCPKKVGEYFSCDDNNVEFTTDEVKAVCEAKKAIFC